MNNYRITDPDGKAVGVISLNEKIQVQLMQKETFLLEGPYLADGKTIEFRLLPCEVRDGS
jgi:hypothetical protein